MVSSTSPRFPRSRLLSLPPLRKLLKLLPLRRPPLLRRRPLLLRRRLPLLRRRPPPKMPRPLLETSPRSMPSPSSMELDITSVTFTSPTTARTASSALVRDTAPGELATEPASARSANAMLLRPPATSATLTSSARERDGAPLEVGALVSLTAPPPTSASTSRSPEESALGTLIAREPENASLSLTFASVTTCALRLTTATSMRDGTTSALTSALLARSARVRELADMASALELPTAEPQRLYGGLKFDSNHLNFHSKHG
mmetsp:Transcript_14527/g.22549  ORF Transcript_14527/g.22549 Transcript_14527/m.22549 type:complete len:260 (+) Transcript_14527:119-898(+)